MFKNHKVIDIHGHISTPPHFRSSAYNLIALRTPGEGVVAIPEAAMKQSVDGHLKVMDDRRIDIQLLSPRPVAMMHWERPFLVEEWSRITNNTIAQQCKMQPQRFIGVAQLPQSRELNIPACVKELDRCVSELGFVGAILNPDPGADRSAPGVDAEDWFPLYKKAEELKATLVIHPSISRDPRLERIPHSYQYNNMTEETLATLLLEHGDVFQRFPGLKIVVCHCGGCLRRILETGNTLDATKPSRGPDNVVGSSGQQGGGQAGTVYRLSDAADRHNLSKNLFFDTCAYDPLFLSTAIRQRGVGSMVFGSEAPGSGTFTLNPGTGKPSDDILSTLESFDFLDDEMKLQIVNRNPQLAFPLLKGRVG